MGSVSKGIRLVSRAFTFFSGNLLDQINDKQNRLLNSELPRHPFYIGLDPCGHKFQRGGQKLCIQRELFRSAEHVLQFARWCDFREWMFLLTVLWFQAQPWRWWLRWVIVPFYLAPSLHLRFASFITFFFFLHLNPVFGFPPSFHPIQKLSGIISEENLKNKK